MHFPQNTMVAMHNTVMTRNTNGVPASETHITRILQAVLID